MTILEKNNFTLIELEYINKGLDFLLNSPTWLGGGMEKGDIETIETVRKKINGEMGNFTDNEGKIIIQAIRGIGLTSYPIKPEVTNLQDKVFNIFNNKI